MAGSLDLKSLRVSTANLINSIRKFWRQVDAIVGQRVGTCRTMWSTHAPSDGCFVEIK